MKNKTWRWVLGLIYIFAVATIWIAASFVVQSVVDEGVSPFLITYICNSLFVVYIPLVEIGRYLEDKCGSLLFLRSGDGTVSEVNQESEVVNLLVEKDVAVQTDVVINEAVDHDEVALASDVVLDQHANEGLDSKGRWTRTRLAKVSLLICPFWFLAQLSFNLSLKYTTVTSNTILSSSSSLFTFLVSLFFLGEKFTWIKLSSVLLCMGGTVIVSLGDSKAVTATAPNPALGDILALVSSAFYAIYITLIRKNIPDEDNDDEKTGKVSMAQFLGFLGLFNLVIFSPIALILHLTNIESFHTITLKQLGLIVGKGLLDNVLSDYLWAKAVLLTTTTVATAGLTIQVPLAAMVDTVIGNAPGFMDYIGAAAVMVGFAGINVPSNTCSTPKEASVELEENHTIDK
ncbi:putative solute carrier family 35 member SLC35F1/F2/F6 [Helianthus annuus]|uniref:Putative eamA-like transporter family n=1 Tax=Helianthus annuus TaxID=4232 RepID=A0A251S4D3_HELAN|nr:solute carrier family 35 member F5 [Helianthus annuus]XP_022016036.1 solute carrier family 35 member F5 [Helianthus annuus]KAF5762554.1 putative solute carrier family 35 member SLC35F1/F2/F6 [Helianthus annuus]KAJ0643041.1 putative solute carrier family 35 member SLC35F1/F2/F6 [Helianthus annuus]KAJ0646907.1 putative solute carrier family 35 member SLC35F1/F2/F6 [Helianthus annuus]KAJ0823679.1 putative solute carrier family 35 member SLC35F1/F2/F6 [Helianthus annuus]KAJ0838409.1 putative s